MDSLKIKGKKPRFAIIGAGIGGLASAIRLTVMGFEVEIFESNPYPGGKLSQIDFSGFRFDAGPSLFTMPQWLEEVFSIAGKDPKAYFAYETLEESSRYFFEDKTVIHGFTDKNRFAQEISTKTQDTKNSILNFLEYCAKIYRITNPVFLQRSLHQVSTYFSKSIIPSLLGLPFIDSGRKMNQANQFFFKDPKTIQIFNRYATYNGSNPYQAPATLNVIPHLEYHFGAYFPLKGMISITESLEKLAIDLGVKIHYQKRVDEIILDINKIKGIRISESFLPFDGLISNMDVYPTYKKLLPTYKSPDKILNRERSSSALIFYWGIEGVFPELDLHNIFFSRDYSEEFDKLAKGQISKDPTVYINITSKKKGDDAPSGMENWFTMINVPANSGQNWDELIEVSRQCIQNKLSRILGKDIKSLIKEERILDPRTIEERTSSYQGSLYGSSSNHLLAAFFRHPNESSKYKGLYFCGGSVHPGGGIPLALLSAKITSEIIEKRYHLR